MFLEKGRKKMDVCILLMLHYDEIDVPEGIDVNKTSATKRCDVCHYWYFLIIVLSFNQMFAIGLMIY